MAGGSRNYLLASLSSADFALLEPHLEPVTLGLRKHLERANKRTGPVLRNRTINPMAVREPVPNV
jgi:hypothetical protein